MEVGICLQAQVGNVINDTDGKAVLHFILLQFIKDSFDVVRLCILGPHTVTSTDDFDVFVLQCRQDVKIQRLSHGSCFLCTIQYSNFLNCFRQYSQQVFYRERTVQVNLDHTNLFSGSSQCIDCFFSSLCYRAHSNDYTFCITCTIVSKRCIFTTSDFTDFLHVVSNDVRNCIEVFVSCYHTLEEDVVVLSTTACYRVCVRI